MTTCPKCGLPKELCVCVAIAKEEQKIKIRVDKRKFRKLITVIHGLDPKRINIKEIAKKLKNKLACGGTVKGNTIELQGDHKAKVVEELINLGFSKESIETD